MDVSWDILENEEAGFVCGLPKISGLGWRYMLVLGLQPDRSAVDLAVYTCGSVAL